MSATVTGTPVDYALPLGGESSSTFSVTVPSGATQLWVAVTNTRFTPPRDVTGITFGGVALTKAVDQTTTVGSPYIEAEWWYLDNPSASTASVVVTFDAAARGGCHAICVTGGATGAPAATGTGTTASVAVASTATGLVLAVACSDEGDSSTYTLDAGTARANFIGSPGAGGPSTRVLVASQPGTGGSVTTSWTKTAGSPAGFAAAAVAITAGASSSAAVTGTGGSGMTSAEVRAGGKTLVLTLTGDTFLTFDNTIRQAIIDGIVAATSPTWGWNAVRSSIPTSAVVRTSSTVCTITLPALANYQSNTTLTLTDTIPATALTGGVAIVAAPTVAIARTSTNLDPVGDYTMSGTATRTRP